MGNSASPQTQLYSSGTDMTPQDPSRAYQSSYVGGSWLKPSTYGTPGEGTASNTALNFAAPGQGLGQGPGAYPGQTGKLGMTTANAHNQVPTGTQGPQTPNYDPTLGMNAVYAQMNQTPGSAVSGPSPDVHVTPTPPTQVDGQPMASQIGPMSLYNMHQYTPWTQASSPMGVSPYWSSPFLTGAPGGKGGV